MLDKRLKMCYYIIKKKQRGGGEITNMGKIIYHRDIEDQVIILDKEIDYSYYRESLIYCITNSRNKTEWMQVIHIGYRNRKPLYLFNDVKERYIAARRLGIDIGFYEITGTDSKHLNNLDSYYLTVLNKINTI